MTDVRNMRKIMETMNLWENEYLDLGEVNDAAEYFGYDIENEDELDSFFAFVHDEWHEVEADDIDSAFEIMQRWGVPKDVMGRLGSPEDWYIIEELLDAIAEETGWKIQAFGNGSAIVFRRVKQSTNEEQLNEVSDFDGDALDKLVAQFLEACEELSIMDDPVKQKELTQVVLTRADKELRGLYYDGRGSGHDFFQE